MAKSGFFGGILVGAALVLAGSYFLKSEKGKESYKKVKDTVDKLRDELKSEMEKGTNPTQQNEEEVKSC